MNEKIRHPRVRVINDEGEHLGELDIEAALNMAKEAGLDLVEVSPDANPPVCKVMDYGKYKYKLKKRTSSAKKKQHAVETKEVRLRPKTGEHDYDVKLQHARKFLEKDFKVQVNMLFRGREMAHRDRGKEMLDRFAEALQDIAKVEAPARMEGYRMNMILAKR